jgi:hypothetical protein
MAIKVDITPSKETSQSSSGQKPVAENGIKISGNIRKTLDGKIMILEHPYIDIVIDTIKHQIITFPKQDITEHVYSCQDKYFKYLTEKGVVLPESIQGGNVYSSIIADYPDPSDPSINASQVVLLSTTKFIEKEMPGWKTEEYIDSEIEERYVDPDEEDSTELGEVPEAPKKGSIGVNRIRRYLSGYGYY